MSVKAHYYRFYKQYRDEFPTTQEAVHFLDSQMEADNIYGCCIEYPDGSRRDYDYVLEKLGPREPGH